MKQWQAERDNPNLKEERMKKQSDPQKTVQKKVNVGAMIAWHELAADALPKQSNIEKNMPESNIKGK